MKKIRVTYTLVVDITPTEDDIDQEQRAIDMVCDEPDAIGSNGTRTVTTEWVEVDE
jgi:hypothetical protein